MFPVELSGSGFALPCFFLQLANRFLIHPRPRMHKRRVRRPIPRPSLSKAFWNWLPLLHIKRLIRLPPLGAMGGSVFN